MLRQLVIFIGLLFCFQLPAQSFKAEQQKYARVKTAYSEKWESLKAEIDKKGINKDGFEMFIRVFKNEKILEVWLKSKDQQEYKLFKTYNICASSGVLGPKRQQGDAQVPEGFYNVASYNPYSSYYLSLGLSYPNTSDKIIGKRNLGGDIMIHGNCVTIGCIPLTDNSIKEVYVMAVEARNKGEQNIPVHIFPTKMDEKRMIFLYNESDENTALMNFWKNIKTGYDYFEKNKNLPRVTTNKVGKYIFN